MATFSQLDPLWTIPIAFTVIALGLMLVSGKRKNKNRRPPDSLAVVSYSSSTGNWDWIVD